MSSSDDFEVEEEEVFFEVLERAVEDVANLHLRREHRSFRLNDHDLCFAVSIAEEDLPFLQRLQDLEVRRGLLQVLGSELEVVKGVSGELEVFDRLECSHEYIVDGRPQ